MQSAGAAWIAAVLMLALVLFSPAVLNDGDTFSHIATGQWMIGHATFPTADPFSFTKAGAPWVAHEWLAELLLACAFLAAGWCGVVVLTAAAAAAAMFLQAQFLARRLPAQVVLLVLVAAVACITPEMLARPHILALPVFVAWVAGVVGARDKGCAPPWRLLPLLCLWANLHGGFIIGIALVVALAAEAVLAEPAEWWRAARAWGGFFVASVAVCLLTPYGFAGLVQPFRLSGLPELSHIGEWQPTDFSTLQPLELLILIGLYLGLGRGARLPPVRLLILLGLLHMALQHTRHLLLIGVIGPILVAGPLGAVWPDAVPGPARRLLAACGAVILVGLVLARLALPIVRTDGPTAPITALAHVPAKLRAQPVLNDYAFGGYLIFAGVRPFIDARAELFGGAALRQYAAITQPDKVVLTGVLLDNHIGWTILSPGNPAQVVIDGLPGWCRLYADGAAVVSARQCR